VSQPIRV